jgi:dephospho-CoA kinase
VGGVGSGKSTLARRLSAAGNYFYIDGDEIGHQVLEFPSIKQKLRSRFGEAIFDSAGHVVRSTLGRIVFGNESDHRRARKDLESIVHPAIRKTIRERIETARATGEYDGILLDAAVLLEAGWKNAVDAVVFVETTEEQRRQRVVEQRGWSLDQWRHREASQLSLEEKRNAADYVIDNSRNIDDAVRELESVIRQTASKQGPSA